LDSELLISADPGEWRAALLEDGLVVELYVERGDRNETGSIHLGRVRRVLPALAAVLVDIGDDRPAFLPQREILPRHRSLHDGERALVQIRREAQGGKATGVTMGVKLRGPRVELIAWSPSLGHERGEGEGGEGTAVLRPLEEAPSEDIAAEAAALRNRWHDILDRASLLDPPARLDPTATPAAALSSALPRAPARIGVDAPQIIPDLRTCFPEATVEHRLETRWPIDLDAVFDRTLSNTVALPGGGTVHLEPTRAAVLIDVDSGTPETGSPERNGLAANLAAAAIIPRQIRLRNLGGGIVVDFVGLDGRAWRDRVRAAFAEALEPDPAGPRILGWTRLGHLELVRPRRGRPIAEALLESRAGGGLVKKAVTVAHETLRVLRREARVQPGRQWRLRVAPDVAAVLAGTAGGAVQDAERRFARKILIEADSGYDREQFQISLV
jgi:ribonuclease G